MAWWESLDLEQLDTTGGVLLLAFGVSVVLVGGGLGVAYLWHLWRDRPARSR